MRIAALGCLVVALAGCQAQTDRSSTAAGTQVPTETSTVTAAEVEAYGGVRFVARPEQGRIERVVDGETTPFATVARPRSMVLSGPVLYVGTDTSVLSVSLADGAVKPVAEGLGPVVGLSLDHVGYLIGAVQDRGLVRITPAGEVTDLAPEPVGALAFEPRSLILRVQPPGAKPVELDILALTGGDPDAWAENTARPMRPFEIDGIMLAGAEYWPYRGDKEPDYPQDVLWGFYPQEGVPFEGDMSAGTAAPRAVACAEKSYKALRSWVEQAPAAFRAAVDKGRSPRFYLWVNDYSEASESWPHEVRPGKFWYWDRKPAVPGRVPGYWKWETTLTRDGQCQIPQPDQIDAYLREATSSQG